MGHMSWAFYHPFSLITSLLSSFTVLRTSIAVCAAVLISGTLARLKWLRYRNLPLPPGPRATSWISGHFSLLPKTREWEGYMEMAKIYGSVMYFRAYHQRMIVLSSFEDCKELLDRRSMTYASRPVIPMVELLGWDFSVALMPYGSRWRTQRRLFQQMFKKDVSLEYQPEQTRKANDMLLSLLEDPRGFRSHIKAFTSATVMSITYGYDIQTKQDPFVLLADTAAEVLTKAFLPGAAIVNVFPVLRHLPSWLPGTGFKKDIEEGRELTSKMKEIPFKYVQDNVNAGSGIHSLVGDRLKECASQEEVDALRDFAPMVYAAGAETTAAALETFFLVMATHPDIQKKAQEVIEAHVGSERLPAYEDWPSLPYIEALIREILRWRIALPLSLPHSTTEDDVYKGYFIPKGVMVMANVWALSRDETRYTDPETFNPDRFIDENGDLIDDDVDYAFGFGRRACPGRHMARASVFIAVCRILATLQIGKAKDEAGNEIPIPGEYTSGLLCHPLEHHCSILSRSAKAEYLIKEAVAETHDRK